MRKVIIGFFILLVIAFVIGGLCFERKGEKEVPTKHKQMKKIVINHSATDSAYRFYGYYKEVFFVYNYEYRDSCFHDIRIDENHGIDFYTNEYGDTIQKTYIDYTNYPRRKE